MQQEWIELSSGCAGASQEIILCYRKIQLERDDLAGGSRIWRHRRWMTESGGRIDRDVRSGLLNLVRPAAGPNSSAHLCDANVLTKRLPNAG